MHDSPSAEESVGCDCCTSVRSWHCRRGTVLNPGEVLPLLTECDIERAVFEGAGRIDEEVAAIRGRLGALGRRWVR